MVRFLQVQSTHRHTVTEGEIKKFIFSIYVRGKLLVESKLDLSENVFYRTWLFLESMKNLQINLMTVVTLVHSW